MKKMKSPKFYTLEATFSYDAEPHHQINDTLDEVVEHLWNLGARDLNVVADESQTRFVLSLIVMTSPGESIETVLGRGMGTVRAAFHACEASTPGWPTLGDMLLYVTVTPSAESSVSDADTDRLAAV